MNLITETLSTSSDVIALINLSLKLLSLYPSNYGDEAL